MSRNKRGYNVIFLPYLEYISVKRKEQTMKILLVSFSPHRRGACAYALKCASEEIISLGGIPKTVCVTTSSGVCLACGECKKESECISEAVNMLSAEIAESDAVIFATPTHFGLAAATALSILSRVLISNKSVLIGKPVFSVATARRAGGMEAAANLDRLIAFSGAPMAGGLYPTLLYGSCEAEIANDEEGLFNLCDRVRRLMWLAECISAGRKSGLLPPDIKARPKTDIHSVRKQP